MVLKTKRLLLAVGILFLFSCAVFMYLNDPLTTKVYPPCVLKTVTGLNCAGCGTVRASYSLLHLEISEAFLKNPLFVLLIPVALYIMIGFTVNTWVGKRVIPQAFNKVGWVKALAVFLLVYSVLRNVPVWPFTLLIP